MKRALVATAVAAMLSGGMFTGAQAAQHRDPPCAVSPGAVAVGQSYTVNVSGLPTMTPLNLFVSNALGTTGTPLGSSATGSYTFTQSATVAGTTTYEFTGVVKNNTTVYATCSVSVS